MISRGEIRVGYLFNDTMLAARRLELLARVYSDSTDAFLRDAVGSRKVKVAIDLGCGPGFTTQQLYDRLRPDQIIGLDNSEHFIALARSRESPRIGFALHDATKTPFPDGPSDLIYARYLLAHLKNIPDLVASWATQLRPEGFILSEEVEWIETSRPEFRRYLQIVAAMLKSQGTELYIGPALDRIELPSLRKRLTRVHRLRVTNRDAASMFSMNIPNWKSQAFIGRNYAAEEIKQLERNLNRIAEKDSDESEIEWGLRQIAWENAATQ
jgi:trans-aconitate 2-methyltransferase